MKKIWIASFFAFLLVAGSGWCSPTPIPPSLPGDEEFTKGFYAWNSKDYASAMKWYLKSAALGNSDGMVGVGQNYQYGDGVPKNYKMALKWYLKAAKKKNAEAENAIGDLYQEGGYGIAQDLKKADQWHKKARAHGYKTMEEKYGGKTAEQIAADMEKEAKDAGKSPGK